MKPSKTTWVQIFRVWLLNGVLPITASVLGIMQFFGISRDDLSRYLAFGTSAGARVWEFLEGVWEFFGGTLTADNFQRIALGPIWLYLIFIGLKNIGAWRRTTIMRHLEVMLAFETPDGSVVRSTQLSKELAVRANVMGFTRMIKPDTARGRIPRDGIKCNIFSTGYQPDITTDVFGDEASGWEIVHQLSKPLPYRWFYPFIPDRLRRDEVTRVEEHIYRDEYAGHSGYFQLISATDPRIPLSIAIRFHPDRIPLVLRAYVVRRNSVEYLPILVQNDSDYIIRAPKLRGSWSVRVAWEFQI